MNHQNRDVQNIPPKWTLRTGKCLLSDMGVISVEGEDASKFVHSMLTNDFALLSEQQARLAALCSPKGRVLATFVGFKGGNQQIFLLYQRDHIAEMLKRLSMFVLRSKAKLSDVSDQFHVWGLTGNVEGWFQQQLNGNLWSKFDTESGALIALYPALQVERWLLVSPIAGPNEPDGDTISTEDWLFGEVMSGVAKIGPALMDRFVPQMLNYESIGGVNFKKGCYPGQEVVARSQFRGTLKRRAFLVCCQAPMQCGDSLCLSDPDAEPVATIVQAAVAPDGEFVAIASGNIGTTSPQDLFFGSSNGPTVALLPLPYRLLEDI
jgi:folate-binding protein YgfZ